MCVQLNIRFPYVWSQIIENFQYFHPLEVVGRASETQFQVADFFIAVISVLCIG